jgi:glycosyltransferase involved in cell wall biosynthesis
MKCVFFANTDWYLYNFRLALAQHLRGQGLEIVFISPDGSYRNRLEKEGFKWFKVDIDRRGLNPVTEFRIVVRLARLLSHIAPDILHNFTIKPIVWGTVAARIAGIPCVVNALTGTGSVFRGETLRGRLLKFPLSIALGVVLRDPRTRTILQNPEDLELVRRQLGVPPTQTFLIRGSGVDSERFSPTGARRSQDVLFVGRLLRDKGIIDFCEAAPMVHRAFPRCRFLIAGSTDPGNPSSLTCKDIARLEERYAFVRFLGHQEDMVSLYRSCGVVVLPTRYGEGVPRSLIEAAACGAPLVATDHPGCREIVRHGMNGFLVSPSDLAGLSEAIGTILANTILIERFGIHSRRIVQEEFSQEIVWMQTRAVYAESSTLSR